LHRFISKEEQLDILKSFKSDKQSMIGASIGIKYEDLCFVDELVSVAGVKIICIDVAHGDSDGCMKATTHIAKKYPHVFLIAGNVATGNAAINLWYCGADAVKVGVGSGSLCSTRIETGAGYPQLSALEYVKLTKPNCEKELNKQLFIISDGGATQVGDFVKALCFSDLVMSGHFFAGTSETPGEIVRIKNGNTEIIGKRFVGSSTHKTSNIEGVEAIVPIKGSVKNVMTKIQDGMRSGLSYQGCSNLYDLKINPAFVKITSAGLKESHPHDVQILKD